MYLRSHWPQECTVIVQNFQKISAFFDPKSGKKVRICNPVAGQPYWTPLRPAHIPGQVMSTHMVNPHDSRSELDMTFFSHVYSYIWTYMTFAGSCLFEYFFRKVGILNWHKNKLAENHANFFQTRVMSSHTMNGHDFNRIEVMFVQAMNIHDFGF